MVPIRTPLNTEFGFAAEARDAAAAASMILPKSRL
jgi:hypothetical protein